MFTGLKSMAKTPLEAEQSGGSADEPSYPFNLSMTLDDSMLERLGLDCTDDECQVGNYVHFEGLAEIVGIHKTDTGEGEKTTLALQTTHFKICDEDEEDSGDGDSPY